MKRFYQDTVDGLRELLQLPSDYHIYFTGSATEIWERLIQNLVEEKSFHLVNGSFSKRFYEIAVQLGKKPVKNEVGNGNGFDSSLLIPADTELIAVTHNETSTGVSLPLDFIYDLKVKNPNALLAVDAVSSLPYPDFDYTKLDSVFFSVQKGFGLPSGLGVWMANDKCLAKAESLLSKGISIGSYHTLPGLQSFAIKNQTPETPNVLSIYVLSKVIRDMIRRGISNIRKETEYKAALLYHTLEKASGFETICNGQIISIQNGYRRKLRRSHGTELQKPYWKRRCSLAMAMVPQKKLSCGLPTFQRTLKNNSSCW